MRAILLLTTVLALPGCITFSSAFSSMTGTKPPEELVVANNFVGMNERDDRVTLKEFMGVDPTRVEWCAAFVNSVLHEVGIASTGSLMARSYLSWGNSTDTPSPGDIMVFSRGSEGWQGHVGFYTATVSYKGNEYWVVLGGNQDNSVSYRLYRKDHWRHLDTRTLRDAPEDAIILANQDWLLDGIPLEIMQNER